MDEARPLALADRTALSVDGLGVGFAGRNGLVRVVNEVSFTVRQGETLALVGESGSGKSVTSLAIMRLLPPAPRCAISGQVRLRRRNGQLLDLLALSKQDMRSVRGNDIAMIFQEPMTSLNPVHTVGAQIAEAITFHEPVSKRAALEKTVDLLDLVGIPEPRKRISSYPHHLSGGMRQRVMIAMALSCNPQVLIADEPTTALDVTIQAQILELLKDLQSKTGMAMIFITHNLGVVAEIADRVLVMYASRIVEQAEVASLFLQPLMPYTMALLRSVPRMDMAGRSGASLETIGGTVPDPARYPSGCAFHPRCRHADRTLCTVDMPELEDAGETHLVRCLRWRKIGREG
jgi:oligopeptide transport system ATP-binding protein